jgi:hypothetical protein
MARDAGPRASRKERKMKRKGKKMNKEKFFKKEKRN